MEALQRVDHGSHDVVSSELDRTVTETFATVTSSGASASSIATQVTVGTIVGGRYRVDTIIGRGGMSIVVGARHLTLNQPVALKFLTRATGPACVERVLREARTIMRLVGEHVVRVFDAGIDGGSPYIVMEKLEGTDVRVVLAKEGPFSVADAVVLVLQLCEVLAEAHALGVVHRDLKPANLFLTRGRNGQRQLKVLDFGIAKVSDETDGVPQPLTEPGMTLGSPGYMSPEQLRSPRDVDSRSDIWAAGVVLYELLAGQAPFAASFRPDVLARVITQEPTPILELRPDVPDGLARAIQECLRKDPSQRMSSAAALARALEPYAPPNSFSMGRIHRWWTR